MVLYVNPAFANSFLLCTICTRNASALRKFACTARGVRVKKTNNPIIYCKSKVYKNHHPNGSFMVFFALGRREARPQGFPRYYHLSRSPCLLHFFLNGEFKMPQRRRRRRRQRERQKSNRLNRQNNDSASLIFCIFLYHHCTTTTWKSLISRFMEDVNKSRRNFLSFSERGYSC